MKREREIILIKPSPRIYSAISFNEKNSIDACNLRHVYSPPFFFPLSFPSLCMYPFIAFPPPSPLLLSLFSLKIFSQIEKLKVSSESSTTNLRGCSATGITNCASRMFDFPSSRPHFRMEMEARSIELALEEGLEPVRNRRWGRFNDLHLEIVAGTHTHIHIQRVIYTQP